MKTINVQYNVFEYQELSEVAKEKVKNELFIHDEFRNINFEEFSKEDLKALFPKSELEVQYSLSYCQGDGFNVYGKLNIEDMFNHIELTEKEKRTMLFYGEFISDIELNYNNRYCYSLKRHGNKNDEKQNLIYELEYNDIKNINHKTIDKFYNLTFDFLANYDNKKESEGYSYLYDIEEEEIADTCDCNEWLFLENGTLFMEV